MRQNLSPAIAGALYSQVFPAAGLDGEGSTSPGRAGVAESAGAIPIQPPVKLGALELLSLGWQGC